MAIDRGVEHGDLFCREISKANGPLRDVSLLCAWPEENYRVRPSIGVCWSGDVKQSQIVRTASEATKDGHRGPSLLGEFCSVNADH